MQPMGFSACRRLSARIRLLSPLPRCSSLGRRFALKLGRFMETGLPAVASGWAPSFMAKASFASLRGRSEKTRDQVEGAGEEPTRSMMVLVADGIRIGGMSLE